MATTIEPEQQVEVRDGDAVAQMRNLPLSRIVVLEGFNPRGEVIDDDELEELAETMRQRGCIAPVRVTPLGDGDYALVAGERRYRAAIKAALMEVPAIIRPAGAAAQDETADLPGGGEPSMLIEALIENDQRSELSPLARARSYGRLIDCGLSVAGISLRVRGSRKRSVQAWVRQHLLILKLPQELQPKVGDKSIPMRAVKSLVEVAAIHPGLAVCAADQVLAPERSYDQYTWADVERDPLQVALSAGTLPDGVYLTDTPYPISAFTLTDGAQKDLAMLEQAIGREITEVRLQQPELEQARAIGALYGDKWQAIVVGEDVASQLVCDYLARGAKEHRRRAREQRKLERAAAVAAGGSEEEPNGGAAADPAAAAAEREQEADRAKQAQREAERQARKDATAFNLELGRGAYTTLARVRVDETVLKVLASVTITANLDDVAARGARYCLPGWVSEETLRNGKTKQVYLDRAEAGSRAGEFLASAVKPGEIAGRQLVLVALAVYAKQEAVAFSNRSWHDVKPKGPWAGEFDELLDQVVKDNLPDATLAILEPVLEQRRQAREERAAARKAREEAAARLEAIEPRIDELTAEEVRQASEDLDTAWTGWTPAYSELRQQLDSRREALEAEQ